MFNKIDEVLVTMPEQVREVAAKLFAYLEQVFAGINKILGIDLL